MTRRISIALAVAAAGGTLGACASPLERRGPDETAYVGSQGGGWELVFESPSTTQALAGYDRRQFDEFSRNDARMNVRPDQPLLASTQWPEPDRASLAYARRISIPTRADSLLFFEGETDRRGYRGEGAGAWRGGNSGGGYYQHEGQGSWGFWR